MKASIFLLVFLCTISSIIGQTSDAPFYTKSFTIASGEEELFLDLHHAHLELNVGDYKDISIIAYVNLDNHKKDDLFSITAEKNNNIISVQTLLDIEKTQKFNVVHIEHKGEASGKTDYNGFSIDRILMMDLRVEIRVPKSVKLRIESQYGSLELVGINASTEVDAIYGDVEVRLDPKCSASTLDFDAQYGTVDIAISQDLKSNIKMKTGYGKIYTFLEDRFDSSFKNSQNCTFGANYKTETNGGGQTNIDVNVGYKNIYLRAL